MKKIIFLIMGFFVWQDALSQIVSYPIFVRDTVRFVRDSNATTYADGDIIADSGDVRYLTFSSIGQGKTDSRGKITYVTVQMDTANATNTTVKVRFFGLRDTTGLWAALPADNGVFQSKFAITGGSVLQFGDVAITMTIFGTTGGGATASEGSATAAIPYQLPNGKLYCVVIATGAFTPKAAGLFRIIVSVDRQF